MAGGLDRDAAGELRQEPHRATLCTPFPRTPAHNPMGRPARTRHGLLSDRLGIEGSWRATSGMENRSGRGHGCAVRASAKGREGAAPSDASVSMVGSTSMAKRLVKPLTSVGSLENFWSKASERLCAGSVDITNTDVLPNPLCL